MIKKMNVKALKAIIRPERKDDRIFAAYLYPNGDAAVSFERSDTIGDATARRTYWKVARGAVAVRAGYGTGGTVKGRVVLHSPGIMHAVIGADAVSWYPPSIEHGSENTRGMGFAVGCLSLRYKDGTDADFYEVGKPMGPGWVGGFIGMGISFNSETTGGFPEANEHRSADDSAIALEIRAESPATADGGAA